MRWFPVLLCTLVCLVTSGQSQVIPDFNQAIDPADLAKEVILLQLDTSKAHRTPINLSIFRKEFLPDAQIQLETFYQKSDQHALLRLGKFKFSSANLFAMSEGAGHTYLKLTDGICTIITSHSDSQPLKQPTLLDKNCVL